MSRPTVAFSGLAAVYNWEKLFKEDREGKIKKEKKIVSAR
jgi:hypothetical protein